MGEDRKLFKTKLCALYQKGRCNRHSCSFAHGYAELRRFSSTFIDSAGWFCLNAAFGIICRRDYRGGDLRDKLERRRSPLHRYSPRRDVRGRQASGGYSPCQSDDERRSDRKRSKKQHFDGQSDQSGSIKVSDRTDDQTGNRKMSHEPKIVVGEQLRQAYAEIDSLNNSKSQLKSYLEDRVQEVESLTSRIQELQNQAFQEKEECKRITSKIKKFVAAHKRHLRLQDDLKRSNDQLQKMGDQLSSDASKLLVNEDNSSINILNDEEITANLMKGEGVKETKRMEKHSRWGGQHAQFDLNKVADQRDDGSIGHRILRNGSESKTRKIALATATSEEKLKGCEPGSSLPPTSMAARALDDGIETDDVEDDHKVTEPTAKGFNKGATNGVMRFQFPLPPPPPVPDHSYAQYWGEDENVDVDALEDDLADVDIV